MAIVMNAPLPEGTDPSYKLRLELKEWEKSFATANKGRKAGREDIKQHPEIASKYKAYDKLRKGHPEQKNSSPPRSSKKRHHPTPQPSAPNVLTPQKRAKHTHPLHPSVLDPYDAPISSTKTPPIYQASIGPTVQKDGCVLGLFDLLSEGSGNKETPSKRSSLNAVTLNAHATPSKNRPSNDQAVGEKDIMNDVIRHSGSPISASKRTYLDAFLTPSTRRVISSPSHRTPGARSGVSKLRFDETPAFLRRHNPQLLLNDHGEKASDDDAVSWSPIAVRMHTEPAGRGLSALVRGLRRMEDEAFDDEMETLREIEAEADGSAAPTKSKAASQHQPPKLQVTESQQPPDMPLGPDRAHDGSSSEEDFSKEGKGRNGRPLKVWKKKGQKRSTRRVKMKPVIAKWKPEIKWKGPPAEEEEEEAAKEEETSDFVGETQLVPGVEKNRRDAGDEGEEEAYVSDLSPDTDVEEREEFLKTKTKTKRKTTDTKGKETENDVTGNPKEPTKKKKKKIAATANPNFRALKIRGKMSKGKAGAGAGGGGRFGRRR